MTTIEEQILAIEKEIRETPYHKGTEHHIGILRARISNLKDKLDEKQSRKSGSGGGYAIKKQGDATVTLVGAPSVGKSTLINKLTNAKSKIAPYAFTTVSVIPGMMDYKNAKIQILDVPGLIQGAEVGKGRGREVLSVIRGSDLLVIITDIQNLDAIERIVVSLEKNGIRINKSKPNVAVIKKIKGGIIVHSNIKQDLSKETIKDVAMQMGIKNAEITIREKIDIEKLIDAFSRNRIYIPAIFVLNKIDLKKDIEIQDRLLISAENNVGLDELKEEIWNRLNFVRIYLVRLDEDPSYSNPMIVPSSYNLKDVAEKIGEEFAKSIKNAQIWGKEAKYPGQIVSVKTKVANDLQIRFI